MSYLCGTCAHCLHPKSPSKINFSFLCFSFLWGSKIASQKRILVTSVSVPSNTELLTTFELPLQLFALSFSFRLHYF